MKAGIFRDRQKHLVFFIVLSVMVTCLIISLLVAMTITSGRDIYADLINSRSFEIEGEIGAFFSPLFEGLLIMREWGNNGTIDFSNEKATDSLLLPLTASYNTISSVIIGSSKGGPCSFFFNDGRECLSGNVMTSKGEPTFKWKRRDEKGRILKEWHGKIPREVMPDLSHYTGELNKEKSDDILWARSNSVLCYRNGHFTVTQGIVLYTGWTGKKDSARYTVLFGIELPGAGIFPAGSEKSSDERIFLITDNNRIINLQPPSSDFYRGTTVSDDPVTAGAITHWNKGGNNYLQPLSFLQDGKRWWYVMKKLSGRREVMDLGVVVPEGIMMGNVYRSSLALLFFSLVMLVGGAFLTLRLMRQYALEKRRAEGEHIPCQEAEILSLICKGESETLEFKSSLRWDMKNSKKDIKLEEVIIKTIAAFNNSEGGILLIGVGDDGSILGLDSDYSTFRGGRRISSSSISGTWWAWPSECPMPPSTSKSLFPWFQGRRSA